MNLEVRDLSAGYGKLEVLRQVSFGVPAGACVAIVGPNGAGKSTLLNAVCGTLKPRQGSVRFNGEDITGARPHTVAARGLALVPEGRQLFAGMTALDNLRVAQRAGRARGATFSVADAFAMFPSLERRSETAAGRLSGGEQQMLAIARALMLGPSLIMLDEPSIGLAPRIVTQVMNAVRELARAETSVLLVEQNLSEVRRVADFAYVLSQGRIVGSGAVDEIVNEANLRKEYLGA